MLRRQTGITFYRRAAETEVSRWVAFRPVSAGVDTLYAPSVVSAQAETGPQVTQREVLTSAGGRVIVSVRPPA
jgi:hypothetical protein